MAEVIKGIKLIRHNANGVNEPDDPTFTWRLDASFRPPEFMNIAFMFLCGGTEEICVRGKTKKALEKFADMNHLSTHPRKLSFKIWQPEVNA